MSNGEVIRYNGEKLAIYYSAASWREGLTFVTEDNDFLQVGIWGYKNGVQLEHHVHNRIKREITRTQEVLFVRSGKVAAHIFDDEENPVRTVELFPGDILILFKGGHGYEILEDNTCVLEVKNGPYPGAEIDRRRIKRII
jgi:hypothetical protein